jgi:hypothetical protein
MEYASLTGWFLPGADQKVNFVCRPEPVKGWLSQNESFDKLTMTEGTNAVSKGCAGLRADIFLLR